MESGLFLDDRKLLRCKGRINNASLPLSSKNPILLPSKHHFSHLVIQSVHENTKHSGIQNTLVTIRETFWREAVKRVLRKCCLCRKIEGAPCHPPITPDLPDTRPRPIHRSRTLDWVLQSPCIHSILAKIRHQADRQ